MCGSSLSRWFVRTERDLPAPCGAGGGGDTVIKSASQHSALWVGKVWGALFQCADLHLAPFPSKDHASPLPWAVPRVQERRAAQVQSLHRELLVF